MRTLAIIFLSITFFLSSPAFLLSHASGGKNGNESTILTPYGFIENKGQITDFDGRIADDVLFSLQRDGFQVFFRKSGISYQFSENEGFGGDLLVRNPLEMNKVLEQIEKSKKQVHRIDLDLANHNPNIKVETAGKSNDYINYLKGKEIRVHHYRKIIYKEVYPGIDWVFYLDGKKLKYDFVIAPGADYQAIKMEVIHHQGLSITKNGELCITSKLGKVCDAKPVSLQGDTQLPTDFKLEGNVVSFKVEGVDGSKELVIDPEIVWGTYFGGTKEDVTFSIGTDNDANVIMAGFTLSETNIYHGGFQNTLAGDYDGFIVKFDKDGTRLWSTYLGGDRADFIYNIAVDKDGNSYTVMSTSSDDDFLAGPRFSSNAMSFRKAIIVKLSPSGRFVWGASHGGPGFNYGFACAVGRNNEVYLVGHTNSPSGIATLGSYQDSLAGGYDGYFVKYDTSGTLLYASYFGGPGEEFVAKCAVDDSNNLILAGETNSTSGLATSSVHQEYFAGGIIDGFLAKFNSSGTRIWATYLGGSDMDALRSMTVNDSNQIYVVGHTTSQNGIAFNAYQDSLRGGKDAFIMKFEPNGQIAWGSYFGGPFSDEALDCALDSVGGILVVGHTNSTSHIGFNSHHRFPFGKMDAFMVKFTSTGHALWGRYFGGPQGDAGSACAIDNEGMIYLAGGSASPTGIAQNGHQNALSGGWDCFLAKFTDKEELSIISNQKQENHLLIYPIPAKEKLYLELPKGWENSNFQVFDLSGRQILDGVFLSKRETIDVSKFKNGVYFIIIKNSDQELKAKFVK